MKGIDDPADPNVRHRTRTSSAAMKNAVAGVSSIAEAVEHEWGDHPRNRSIAVTAYRQADERLSRALQEVRACRESIGDPHQEVASGE